MSHVAVNNYDEVLRSLLDKYAPVKERVITVRPSAPWYTAQVTAEKRKRRRLERKWRASRLTADREQYVHQCGFVINLIKSVKSEYYSSVIKENSGNQKVLIKTVQKLLQKPIFNCYPPSDNGRMRADEFATFFATNIDTLHNDLLVKKSSSIYKHYNLQHNSEMPERFIEQFHTTKCSGKFDCLVKEMLYIRMRKPTLNVQTDSIRAKVFV